MCGIRSFAFLMSNNQPPPDRDFLPSPSNGPQPSYPLGAPRQYGLGQSLPGGHKDESADDDVINLADLWRMVVKHK